MAAEVEELDLTKPGKLWAKAENEGMTVFHLVIPQAQYTKNKLTLNPTINPMDELMRPLTISKQDAAKDKDDIAWCDLDLSGRAKEIMDKLSERYARGEPRVEKVLGVYIAMAADGNRIPDAQAAEVKEFKLVTIPSISLKPAFLNLHPNNVQGTCCACPLKGKKQFELELNVTGDVSEVELTAIPTPSFPDPQITATPGGGGKGKATIKTKEGTKVAITVSADFKVQDVVETKSVPVIYDRVVPGGWRTSGGRWDYGPQTGKRSVWTGGFITFRATGTGKYKNLINAVSLKMETFQYGWIATGLPPHFYHNVC